MASSDVMIIDDDDDDGDDDGYCEMVDSEEEEEEEEEVQSTLHTQFGMHSRIILKLPFCATPSRPPRRGGCVVLA